jgi:hypothetical protein
MPPVDVVQARQEREHDRAFVDVPADPAAARSALTST